MAKRRAPLPCRRSLLLAAPALILAPSVALAATRTPAMTEGPFYPRRIPADSDADLTRFNGGNAPGEVIEVLGRVTDAKARPLQGAVVELWHCDPKVVYAHVGYRTDPHFQGFGAVKTDADGGYRFRTTRPGLYPGRARHIHFKIRGPRGALPTQMFFPGDPSNRGDFLLDRTRNPGALIAVAEEGAPPRYRFDVVI